MLPPVTRQCAVMKFASGVGQRVSLTLPVTMPPGAGDQAAGSRMEKYLEKVTTMICTMLAIALVSAQNIDRLKLHFQCPRDRTTNEWIEHDDVTMAQHRRNKRTNKRRFLFREIGGVLGTRHELCLPPKSQVQWASMVSCAGTGVAGAAPCARGLLVQSASLVTFDLRTANHCCAQ
jgi:hypothetical protein